MPAGFHQPSADIESVVGIQFGIFSPDEIIRRSVVEITTQATYDGNEPKIGGLFDPRMGVLENGKTCRSCGQTNHGCPGHFGHYRLARPVYFVQFMGIIQKVLKCICIRCSKLLIDKAAHPQVLNRRGESRWKVVTEAASKIHRCGQETEDGCGTVVPSRIQLTGILRLMAEWDIGETKGEKKVSRQPLEVEYVLRLFRQISDEDVDFMGLSHFWCRPDWMICTVLPIPPPQVRPSVVQDNNQRSEDDLTHKLFEIIKANKKLQEQIGKNGNRKIIDDMTTLLQYHIATLVNNKIPGVAPSAQRGGRPLKSLQQRIGSKEGRVRFNIQGKRVEQSARSVITGDPNISIAEVGVPQKIAMNLTRPEVVTAFNRERLYKYVQNGADTFPGAKSIVRKNGSMISLKHVNTHEITLNNGDIVNRHLMDGDIILFNRQPTLHRMSMMGHRVRVLPFNTFRLNVTVTRPYNADFDGDEMNAHIPQSYEATAELQDIAAVPYQIIRPRDSTPVIGVVQDALAGVYLGTSPGNYFTRREFMNMVMKNPRFQDVPEAKAKDPTTGAPRFTGQQLVQTLLAPITMTMKNKSYDADKQDYNIVKIRDGEFLQGVLDKGVLNASGTGILHTTYNDYGPQAAVELLDGLQNIIEQFLINKGFSVGVSDLIADEATKKQMENAIAKQKKELDDLILQLHTGLFVNNSGKSNQEEFETKAIGILNKAIGEAGKIGVQSLSHENRLMVMIRSGSKGDENNVAQMIACVGQQAPEGKRIPYGFTDRTLPHYKMYDDSAEARGFVDGSFLRGLTPQEFFFHAMSGREGLIDTAVKTAETGYTQRQLIKAMEDLLTQNDGTVRDATGKIVQFRYGEDGTSNTKLETVSIPLEELSTEEIQNTFGMAQSTNLSEEDMEALDRFVGQILEDRKVIVEGVYGNGPKQKLTTPINLERVLLNIETKFSLSKNQTFDPALSPAKVIADIQSVLDRTQPYHKIWCAAVRYWLAPHQLYKRNFTVAAWEALCELLTTKNWKSWATPGELVGIVAAQSIGEPATQMTLNTFHQAGVAAKSAMTRGVPRLKELLKVTKNPKATSLTITLNPAFRSDKDMVRQVSQDFELTLLKDIVRKAAIYFDPNEDESVIEEDRDVIKFFKAFELRQASAESEEQAKSPWILRLEFDREAMFNKNITMDDVHFVIKDQYGFLSESASSYSKDLPSGSDLHIIYTDYNASKLIMRIKLTQTDSIYADELIGLKKLQNTLLYNTVIRGVPGIRAVTWRKDTNRVEMNQATGKYEKVTQYLLDTDGSNFVSVLTHPMIDPTKLYSTNVYDMYDQLGIEATRAALYSEMSGLFPPGDINYRHLGLLCDVMTHGGKLMSVDRNGINKMNTGPIAKACFEETERVLMKAALFGEMDPCTGVSANIMTGQPIRAGTAFTQILLDDVALVRLMKGMTAVPEEEEDEQDLTQNQINQALYGAEVDPCSAVETTMNLVLPTASAGKTLEEEDIELVVV